MIGPWNAGEQWEVIADREAQAAVDGGDGSATVALDATQTAALDAMSERLLSNPELDRVTGADLGAGPGASSTTGDIQR